MKFPLNLAIVLIYIVSWSTIKSQTSVTDNFELIENQNTTLNIVLNDGNVTSCSGINILQNATNCIVARNINLFDIDINCPVGFYGKDSFQYELQCSSGTSSAWVYLNITPINQAPIANTDNYTFEEDKKDTLNILTNDYDRESQNNLLISIIENPKNGTVTIFQDKLIFTPNINFYGIDSIKYSISDNGFGSASLKDSAWVFLNISPINDSLKIATNLIKDTLNEGDTLCINIKSMVSDPDNENNWTSIISNNTKNGTSTLKDGILCYVPNKDYYGEDTLEINICDTTSLCSKIVIQFHINNILDKIIAVDDSFEVYSLDTIVDIIANDISPDKNFGVIQLLSENKYFVIVNNKLNYTNDTSIVGVDSISYRVSNDNTNWDTATIKVYKNCKPNVPIAKNDSFTLYTFSNITINTLLNDWKSIYPTTIQLISLPKKCILTLVNDTIKVTTTEQIGKDSFKYKLCNTLNQCSEASVYIEILDSTFKPSEICKTDSTFVKNNTTYCLDNTIINYDSSKSYTFNILKPNSQNSVSMNTTGCWTINFDSTNTGIDSFQFVVCKSNALNSVCDTVWHYIIFPDPNIDDITVLNSFSPNNDGINESLVVENIEKAKNNTMTIFSRWNEILFKGKNYNNDWIGHNNYYNKGKLVAGVYFYIFEYTFMGQNKVKKGTVTITD